MDDHDKQIQAEREELEKNWKAQVDEHDVALKATHIKKEFTFSTSERLQLLKITGINAFADQIKQLAQQLADNVLNLEVLTRLSITPSPEKKILYEPAIGKFVIWEPRIKKPTVETSEPKPQNPVAS